MYFFCHRIWTCFCLLGCFQKQTLREIVKKNNYLNVRIFKEIYGAVPSANGKNLSFKKRYSIIYLTRKQVQEQFIKACPDIIIKVSVEAILVALFPTLKIFFSINIKFWKTYLEYFLKALEVYIYFFVKKLYSYLRWLLSSENEFFKMGWNFPSCSCFGVAYWKKFFFFMEERKGVFFPYFHYEII